jgi:hypothetical protein
MVFGTQEKKVIKSVTIGLKSLKKHYLRLALSMAVLFSVGFLSGIPFRYVQATLVLDMVQALIFTLIGSCGILWFFRFTPKILP